MEDPCEHCKSAGERDLYIKQSHSYAPILADSKVPALKHQQEDLQKYKFLFESAPDAILIADAESGRILNANQSAADLLGIPVKQIIGMHQSQLHPAEEAQRYKEIFEEHIELENAILTDNLYVSNKDGRKIPIQINATVAYLGDKKVIYGVFRDITKQKQLMQQLAASETRFKRLADAAFEAIAIHQNGKMIDVNQQYLDMFGYSLEEALTTPGLEMVAPQSRNLVQKMMESKFEGRYEAFGIKKDGTIFPIEIQAKETLLEGYPIRIGAIRDMTGQYRLEQLLKAVYESSQDCIVILDRNFRYLYVNQADLNFTGLDREKKVGHTIQEVWPDEPDFAGKWQDRIKEAFQTGQVYRFEDADALKGSVVHSESTLYSIGYPGDAPFAVCVVYRDVTEQKQLQQQIADSERRYRELYHNAHVALFRTTLDGLLLDCNKACLLFFGHSSKEPEENYIKKIRVIDYYADAKQRQVFIETLMKNKRVNGFEAKLKTIDGSIVWGSFSAELFPEAGYIEGALYDITIKKALTKAEQKVLRYLMEGKSNKQIARELGRSVRTIEDHRAHVMQKLGVDNLVDLTQKALNLQDDQESQ